MYSCTCFSVGHTYLSSFPLDCRGSVYSCILLRYILTILTRLNAWWWSLKWLSCSIWVPYYPSNHIHLARKVLPYQRSGSSIESDVSRVILWTPKKPRGISPGLHHNTIILIVCKLEYVYWNPWHPAGVVLIYYRKCTTMVSMFVCWSQRLIFSILYYSYGWGRDNPKFLRGRSRRSVGKFRLVPRVGSASGTVTGIFFSLLMEQISGGYYV